MTKRLTLPPALLALDFLGVLLVGLGLAEWLAGTELVPEALRFDHYPIALVVLGVLLMLPMVFHIIGQVLTRDERRKEI